MFPRLAWVMIFVTLLIGAAFAKDSRSGTPDEAKATLEKAIEALKADKADALEMFNKGEGGFKDRDLYVFCADASTGIETAHPSHQGFKLQDMKDSKDFAFGREIMDAAKEGSISEISYMWPKPGSEQPREDDLLHEGCWPDLRCWVLQVTTHCSFLRDQHSVTVCTWRGLP